MAMGEGVTRGTVQLSLPNRNLILERTYLSQGACSHCSGVSHSSSFVWAEHDPTFILEGWIRIRVTGSLVPSPTHKVREDLALCK